MVTHRIKAFIVGFVSLALLQSAAASETPPSLPGAKIVSAEEVRALVAKGAVLIDARVANEFVTEHIAGAKNVPYKEKSVKAVDFDAAMDSFDLAALPADKKAPVVFYCNAGECWKSYKASTMAIRAGYTRVYWMRGGIPEWKQKGMAVE